MTQTTHIYTFFDNEDGTQARVWVKSVAHWIPRAQNLIDEAISYHRHFGQVEIIITDKE